MAQEKARGCGTFFTFHHSFRPPNFGHSRVLISECRTSSPLLLLYLMPSFRQSLLAGFRHNTLHQDGRFSLHNEPPRHRSLLPLYCRCAVARAFGVAHFIKCTNAHPTLHVVSPNAKPNASCRPGLPDYREVVVSPTYCWVPPPSLASLSFVTTDSQYSSVSPSGPLHVCTI